MTAAIDTIKNMLENQWSTYPEDLPKVFGLMCGFDESSHLIIERGSDGWPACAQIASFGGTENPMIHAELQHPAMQVPEGDPDPELPASVLDAIHADGWNDPDEAASPNFWIQMSVHEAKRLADIVMKAMLMNLPPQEILGLELEAWGPAFGTEA